MGTRSDWYKVLSESGLVIQSAVLCESPSKVLLFSTVRLSINWFLNQFAMQKCFPFSFKRIIFTLCIAVVMLHSVVAFTPYFRFAARAKHGKVMNSASIMTDVTSKKSFVSTGSLDSAVIDKNLKLGVLFLNLGGPETIKV